MNTSSDSIATWASDRAEDYPRGCLFLCLRWPTPGTQWMCTVNVGYNLLLIGSMLLSADLSLPYYSKVLATYQIEFMFVICYIHTYNFSQIIKLYLFITGTQIYAEYESQICNSVKIKLWCQDKVLVKSFNDKHYLTHEVCAAVSPYAGHTF